MDVKMVIDWFVSSKAVGLQCLSIALDRRSETSQFLFETFTVYTHVLDIEEN